MWLRKCKSYCFKKEEKLFSARLKLGNVLTKSYSALNLEFSNQTLQSIFSSYGSLSTLVDLKSDEYSYGSQGIPINFNVPIISAYMSLNNTFCEILSI